MQFDDVPILLISKKFGDFPANRVSLPNCQFPDLFSLNLFIISLFHGHSHPFCEQNVRRISTVVRKSSINSHTLLIYRRKKQQIFRWLGNSIRSSGRYRLPIFDGNLCWLPRYRCGSQRVSAILAIESQWYVISKVILEKGWYPLVMSKIVVARSTIFNGKIHYFYGHLQQLC